MTNADGEKLEETKWCSFLNRGKEPQHDGKSEANVDQPSAGEKPAEA